MKCHALHTHEGGGGGELNQQQCHKLVFPPQRCSRSRPRHYDSAGGRARAADRWRGMTLHCNEQVRVLMRGRKGEDTL